jgi:hypothetical protein
MGDMALSGRVPSNTKRNAVLRNASDRTRCRNGLLEGDEMTCLIVGDSIAVGLASALKGCIVAAKVGMGSGWIAAHTPGTIVDVAFISSGSNDPTNPNLSANLESTRMRLTAGRIVWIKPVNPHARGVVTAVAAAHGDKAVAFMPGRDNVHPESYEALAREVNGGGS